MIQDTYQIRLLVEDEESAAGPVWTRDSLRGAEGLALNAARTHHIVGVFAGPQYAERVRVALSEDAFTWLQGLARNIDPHTSEKNAAETNMMARFIALGWATFVPPAGIAYGWWVITVEGLRVWKDSKTLHRSLV